MKIKYEIEKRAQDSDLKSRAILVLQYMLNRINKERTCFPSIKTIAKKVHISISTVKRALKELVEKGFVKKIERFVKEKNGAQTSNLYILDLPEIDTNENKANIEKPIKKIKQNNKKIIGNLLHKIDTKEISNISFVDIINAQFKSELGGGAY